MRCRVHAFWVSNAGTVAAAHRTAAARLGSDSSSGKPRQSCCRCAAVFRCRHVHDLEAQKIAAVFCLCLAFATFVV